MKQYKIALASLAAACAFSGNASAQNDLGGFLGNLLEQSAKARGNKDKQNEDGKDKTGSFLEGLSNIFNSNKIASADDLVGEWKYSGPAVFFESDDAMQKIGGKIAADRMEKKIEEIISKYHLDKNPMVLEFTEDGNFAQKYKKFNLRGTYTVEEKDVILKYSGRYQQLVGRTQIDGSSLVIVMDLSRLNEFILGVASRSNDPKMQLLTRLLGNVKGVSCGVRFEKQ